MLGFHELTGGVMMNGVDFLYIRVHAMPCVNRCRHCWIYGSPEGTFMDTDVVFRILEEAAEFKSRTGIDVFPQFFMEPSIHPDFIEIVGRMWNLGLTIGDASWVSTNGHGIAGMSDGEMARLAATGVQGIGFTIYGLEGSHDEYAGRKGAWDDIEKAARRCDEYGISWLTGILMTRASAAEYRRIRDAIDSWGTPCGPSGAWFVPHWDGRAINDAQRVTIDELMPLMDKPSSVWKSESMHIDDILASEELSSKRATYSRCNIAHLDVHEDLWVRYGGGCDASPFDLDSEDSLLGNLTGGGFLPMVEKYVDSPPLAVRRLAEMTWGELAREYGDGSNTQVFHLPNLVLGKWGRQYLRDSMPE
jgi:hypothetical protein